METTRDMYENTLNDILHLASMHSVKQVLHYLSKKAKNVSSTKDIWCPQNMQ